MFRGKSIGIDGRNIELDTGRAPGKRTLMVWGSNRLGYPLTSPHPPGPGNG